MGLFAHPFRECVHFGVDLILGHAQIAVDLVHLVQGRQSQTFRFHGYCWKILSDGLFGKKSTRADGRNGDARLRGRVRVFKDLGRGRTDGRGHV